MTKKLKLKIIPLGGLDEIGKNITLFEYGNDIVVIDCGLAFPSDEMFGVDLVIPDFTYLVKNKEKVRAVVLTHGHEDHIGGLPYFLRDIQVPIYGTKLTLGILKNKLKEHRLSAGVNLVTIEASDVINIGCFKIEFIRSNHSIADAVGIALHTSLGIVVHTGDFKIDTTPIDSEMIDLARLGQLGNQGVLALLSDSTNAERPGYAMSERVVGKSLNDIFRDCDSRIIVATFASNIHRVQQIVNYAAFNGRKVAISGRSMENVVSAAVELGYMKVPPGTFVEIDKINKYKKNELVLITTGSQGEPMSALTRMAFSDHRKVEIEKGDVVIISANPIPGNEKLVSKVIDELYKLEANVIYDSSENVHVSGHACQEELKMMLALIRPKYFMPVHGEFRHLKHHAAIAKNMGIPDENIFIMSIGKTLEIDSKQAKIGPSVPAGKVLVDGLGVGDVGNIVLKDRKHLSQDGLIVVAVSITREKRSIVAGPDIISRGFVYVREAEDLMENAKQVAKEAIENCAAKNANDWTSLKTSIKNNLSQYLYEKTKRSPMILPVIMEV